MTIAELLDMPGDELVQLDEKVMAEVVGVAQAVGDLRKALDLLEQKSR